MLNTIVPELLWAILVSFDIFKYSQNYISPFLCPPSKKGGHIALLLSVGRYVGDGLSVQQFPFIFFALVAHIEMKFGIQIYCKNI
jgi:hypothetical protein